MSREPQFLLLSFSISTFSVFFSFFYFLNGFYVSRFFNVEHIPRHIFYSLFPYFLNFYSFYLLHCSHEEFRMYIHIQVYGLYIYVRHWTKKLEQT